MFGELMRPPTLEVLLNRAEAKVVYDALVNYYFGGEPPVVTLPGATPAELAFLEIADVLHAYDDG